MFPDQSLLKQIDSIRPPHFSSLVSEFEASYDRAATCRAAFYLLATYLIIFMAAHVGPRIVSKKYLFGLRGLLAYSYIPVTFRV